MKIKEYIEKILKHDLAWLSIEQSGRQVVVADIGEVNLSADQNTSPSTQKHRVLGSHQWVLGSRRQIFGSRSSTWEPSLNYMGGILVELDLLPSLWGTQGTMYRQSCDLNDH
jgi:hypothetical protein